MTVSPLDCGASAKAIVCHYNITERVLKEQEVQQATERLKEVYGMVAHDFRSPLTSIKGSLNLLRHNQICDLPLEAIECITIAEQTADYLLTLATDFLDVQSTGEKAPPALSACNVSEICSTAAQNLIGIAKQHRIDLTVTAPANTLVRCHRPSIVRVLINLLSNALKYTPPGKHVSLSALPYDDWVVFSIADQGPGIPQERLAHLFEPFGYSSHSDVVVGSGLGLAAVKRLLELHGTHALVKSEVAVGTCFSFRLKIANPEM